MLREKLSKLAVLMDGADSDVFAFMSFPKSHRVQSLAVTRVRHIFS